jgi:hypothetical protein
MCDIARLGFSYRTLNRLFHPRNKALVVIAVLIVFSVILKPM